MSRLRRGYLAVRTHQWSIVINPNPDWFLHPIWCPLVVPTPDFVVLFVSVSVMKLIHYSFKASKYLLTKHDKKTRDFTSVRSVNVNSFFLLLLSLTEDANFPNIFIMKWDSDAFDFTALKGLIRKSSCSWKELSLSTTTVVSMYGLLLCCNAYKSLETSLCVYLSIMHNEPFAFWKNF